MESGLQLLAYRGASEIDRVARSTGVWLLVWVPFIFSVSLAAGLGTCVLVSYFCRQFFLPRIDWFEIAYSTVLLLFAIAGGMIASGTFRGGIRTLKTALSLLRDDTPILEANIENMLLSEVSLYIIAVLISLLEFSFNGFLVSLAPLGAALMLTVTRLVLKRAQRIFENNPY
ncbi:MAG TPA: hypothetical protein VHM90_05290 [Phycisphaerae bacterium]|nr:hypothetical protein [Phycisphaerae bacterium]